MTPLEPSRRYQIPWSQSLGSCELPDVGVWGQTWVFRKKKNQTDKQKKKQVFLITEPSHPTPTIPFRRNKAIL